jgi:hypothetical protein
MSTQDRKIGFYNFNFEKYGSDEKLFNRELFRNIMEFVRNLHPDKQIISIPKYNKAITIEKFAITSFYADHVVRIVFKSCKYNHNPDYMSSVDGSERESDKKPHEGEKEKTHLCIRISTYDAELILEERKNGVSINEITRYLNQKLRDYLSSINKPKNLKLIHGVIPSQEFLEMLEGMKDIKVAELYTSKLHLGSEAMGVIEYEDNSMKDNIVVIVNSKPKESMAKRNFRKLYNSITSTEGKVNRIRLYGHDENNNPIRLDSDSLKKLDYVTAVLDENGTVNSESIFEKMFEILGITGGQP